MHHFVSAKLATGSIRVSMNDVGVGPTKGLVGLCYVKPNFFLFTGKLINPIMPVVVNSRSVYFVIIFMIKVYFRK